MHYKLTVYKIISSKNYSEKQILAKTPHLQLIIGWPIEMVSRPAERKIYEGQSMALQRKSNKLYQPTIKLSKLLPAFV